MCGSIEKINSLVILFILPRVSKNLVNQRLRELREGLALSQEALGAQGFVSTSGWVKIESGKRQPSDHLLKNLVSWLEQDGYIKDSAAELLLEELLALKYMDHISDFIQKLAATHYKRLKKSGFPQKILKK